MPMSRLFFLLIEADQIPAPDLAVECRTSLFGGEFSGVLSRFLEAFVTKRLAKFLVLDFLWLVHLKVIPFTFMTPYCKARCDGLT